MRTDNLYVSGTLSNGVPGMLFSIRVRLLGRNIMFAEGKILPNTADYFEKWYRQLPIHRMFLEGKESEIHYLAPDAVQPDFPFVNLDWKLDCKASSDDDTL